MSIDPMTMMDADMNPGMFNRYAYSMNDPVNMLDPTGMCSEGASDSQTICATEDAVKDTVGMAVYNGIKAVANVARAAQGKGPVQDVDMGGEEQYGHEAEANSVGEEVAAVASAVVEAGIDTRNPVKIANKFKTCCFVAGTTVETEAGPRSIESIKVGDRVLARNPLTGETALKAVTDLISQNERLIWTVTVTGENGESETFETTDDHPWWIVDEDGNGSWKTTDALADGMNVTTAANQIMTIDAVVETSETDYTYNLTVADFETYFVGKQKVLVHNCNKGRQKGDRFKSSDDAQEQYDDNSKAQRSYRKGKSNQIIDSTKKSKQRAKTDLRKRDWTREDE